MDGPGELESNALSVGYGSESSAYEPRKAHVLSHDEQRKLLESKTSVASEVSMSEFVPAKPAIAKPRAKMPNFRAKRMSIPTLCLATAEAALEDNQIDRQELQWEDNIIGTGATAKVFKGLWCGKEVAIKELILTTRGAMLLRQEVAFLREAAIVSQISHDNLVQSYGLAFERQPYLLITEFCGGGTCYHLLHVNQDVELVMKQQLKMTCDLACAMDYLHKHKPRIIHRDLKSLNILLLKPVTSTTDIPHVKVADFGHSKIKENPETGWGHMTKDVGTVNWMAPEISTFVYNEKVDIYSFAMVLFEILCEEIPFIDLENTDVAKAVAKGLRPDMEAVPPFMPTDLVELMVQCWAHQPGDRPSFEYICTVLDAIFCRYVTDAKGDSHQLAWQTE